MDQARKLDLGSSGLAGGVEHLTKLKEGARAKNSQSRLVGLAQRGRMMELQNDSRMIFEVACFWCPGPPNQTT